VIVYCRTSGPTVKTGTISVQLPAGNGPGMKAFVASLGVIVKAERSSPKMPRKPFGLARVP